jgi:hypothetical protein
MLRAARRDGDALDVLEQATAFATQDERVDARSSGSAAYRE